MTSKDCVEKINQIEKIFPVEKWRIDDIFVWPALRIMIYKKMMEQMYLTRENNSFIEALKKRFYLFINQKRQKIIYYFNPDRDSSKKTEGKSEVLFYSFRVCRTLLNGVWYDKYCDPLTDILRKNNIKVLHLEENYYINKDNLPRQNGDICANFNALLYDYISHHAPISHFNKENFEKYDEFLDYLKESAINVNIADFAKHEIKKKVKKIILTSGLFEDILIKNGAKICFIVSYYHDSGMALCLACHKLGIKVVELQHGSQRHPAYSGWNRIPQSGYDTLPNLFWNWNKEDAEDINKWADKTEGKHKAFSGGYPWLNIWKYGSDTTKASLSLYKQTQKSDPRKIRILFSLSGSSGLPADWVMNAVRNSPKNWLWIFRIHPNQTNNASQIKKLIEIYCPADKFEIELGDLTPLPLSLAGIDIHVTGSSSVIMEADMFSVPSVAIHEDGFASYPEQAKNGVVVLAKNSEDLIEKIMLQIEKKPTLKYNAPENGNVTKNTLEYFLRDVGILNKIEL